MNIITQSFIQLPSFGEKTVRVNGDLASVYDLLTAAGVTRASYRVLSETCEKFPKTGRLLTKTTFMGNSTPSLAIRLEDWAELGDCIQQHGWAVVSTRTLQKLNQDLGIRTIDVSPVPAIAPSVIPDVPVTNYGKKNGYASQNARTSEAALIADGKLIFPELNNAEIRSDGDRFSVYDFIKIVGGQKNPREVWKRIAERYSPSVTLCDTYKFPHCKGGAAQPTPATDREGIIQIAQLLPGEFGAKFRAEAAKIILAYFNADLKLADAVVDRAIAKGKVKEVEQHAARTQGIILRKQLTSVLAAHGVNKDGYRMVTNAIYIGLLGKPASALRKEMGLAQGENVRSRLNPVKWMSIGTIEAALPVQLEKQQAWGNEACAKIAYETALQIGQLIGLAA